MNGFMTVFVTVTVLVVTCNVAAGQNTTLSCSDEDVAEHNRLVAELNSCDPCDEEEQEPDDCRCCALYESVLALRELCVPGGYDDDKRRAVTINVLSNINVNIRDFLKRFCINISGASAMAAGATVIAFTALAATMF